MIIKTKLEGNYTIKLRDSRIINCSSITYGTTKEWNESGSAISDRGRMYVYTDYYTDVDGIAHPGIKFGDGVSSINELPFLATEDSKMLAHMSDTGIHVTPEEKKKWNEAATDQSITHYGGTTTTEISDGSTVSPILVGNESYTPVPGDIFDYGEDTFLYKKNGKWSKLSQDDSKSSSGYSFTETTSGNLVLSLNN